MSKMLLYIKKERNSFFIYFYQINQHFLNQKFFRSNNKIQKILLDKSIKKAVYKIRILFIVKIIMFLSL